MRFSLSPSATCIVLALGVGGWLSLGQSPAAEPKPTHADVAYGSHAHQVLDIYLPPGDGPFPVIVWYGGL